MLLGVVDHVSDDEKVIFKLLISNQVKLPLQPRLIHWVTQINSERWCTFFAELALSTTADGAPAAAQFQLMCQGLSQLAETEERALTALIVTFQLRWFLSLGELPELTTAGLRHAHLPGLDETKLAVARALSEGATITDLDTTTLRQVGQLAIVSLVVVDVLQFQLFVDISEPALAK